MPTLEALISLLKETKTIGKNLGKIRALEGGRELTKGRSSLTHEKVIVDALLLTRELITRGDLCRQRGRSQWEDQPQGEVVVERRVRHRRINALWTSSSSSFGSSNFPGGSSPPWASRASDKIRTSGPLSSRRSEHRELLREIRELRRRRRRIKDADIRAREP